MARRCTRQEYRSSALPAPVDSTESGHNVSRGKECEFTNCGVHRLSLPRQLEVKISLADWQVLAAYPSTSLVPDGGRQKLRWFLKVKTGGIVEDLLTGTETSGLFVELL